MEVHFDAFIGHHLLFLPLAASPASCTDGSVRPIGHTNSGSGEGHRFFTTQFNVLEVRRKMTVRSLLVAVMKKKLEGWKAGRLEELIMLDRECLSSTLAHDLC